MDNTPITRAEFAQLRQEILELLDFSEFSFPVSPVEVMHSTQASSTESNIEDRRTKPKATQTSTNQNSEIRTPTRASGSAPELADALLSLGKELKDREADVERLEGELKRVEEENQKLRKAYQELQDQDYFQSCGI
ncbi:hypothetical protein NA56DRAFT_703520 [Hyaloscypha hepaticicola]|uniref:Uncharacterized protein n=1 Tax=Hyaloscypha hepaticicola TaxID=2082293 RepID=A0A2J6Q525_9HELO|nr:hypothetical protein NA56DRAFT_703520 [Hyaloscypha hepaticicola]